ncbi:hypothetical protein [Microbacterium murale]|uniref:Uncharacterized protein n=1 Tax=Microbacterium murale TaxID=1081040 RepID=A0ABQ1RM13_9MICO|nr:hypothetical protein [Microbacterium murale]GGD74939.1 hypothetical protein GCM10007269_17450 [Microbacterium murale]
MVSAEESAELRMLQAKAYGPDGGLSVEELERLQELESSGGRLRLAALAQPVSSLRLAALAQHTAPVGPRPSLNDPQEVVAPQEAASPQGADRSQEPGRVVERAEGETKRAERASASRSGSSAEPHAPLRPWRRHPIGFALGAVAAALVLGLGIGWAVWGWDADAYALASAHAEQRAEIEATDDFDPGTVAPVAEQYGVVVWQAERSDGDEVCVIVTGPDEMIQNGCIPSEQLKDSVWPNATATVPEGEEKAGQQLVAGLIPTMTGELVPFIQVWDQDASGWESQYSDAELAQLHELEASGYEGSTLGILGYDGDTVVWSNWVNGGFCVIAAVDGGPIEACAEDAESDITLMVIVDGVPTEYLVQQSEMRGPVLTIIRHSEAAIGELDPETGDPIEFTFDDPMFDDLVSDGETGETGG